MVNRSKAIDLMKEVNVENPHTINLSNKSFDAEAAEVLASKIGTFENLSVVDISDIIAGRAEDEALRVLEIICNRSFHAIP